LSGVVAKNNFSTTAKQGVGSQGGDRGHRETPPDFEKAAKHLLYRHINLNMRLWIMAAVI